MGLAVKLFGKFVEVHAHQFRWLRKHFLQANLKKPFHAYLCECFFYTLLSPFLSLPLSLFLYFWLANPLCFLLNSIPLLCILYYFYYPVHRSAQRRNSIEANLPFALIHMGSIAEAGVTPYLIFKLMGQFPEYGELAVEMRKIARNVEAYGMDPMDAIREVSRRTPSEELRSVLNGLVATTEAGGSVKHYLRVAGERALFEWRMRREKFIRQLSMFAEFYTGILIAAPLFLIALFAVMGMIQPQLAGFDVFTLTQLCVYLIMPAMNAGYLAFLKGIEVRI